MQRGKKRSVVGTLKKVCPHYARRMCIYVLSVQWLWSYALANVEREEICGFTPASSKQMDGGLWSDDNLWCYTLQMRVGSDQCGLISCRMRKETRDCKGHTGLVKGTNGWYLEDVLKAQSSVWWNSSNLNFKSMNKKKNEVTFPEIYQWSIALPMPGFNSQRMHKMYSSNVAKWTQAWAKQCVFCYLQWPSLSFLNPPFPFIIKLPTSFFPSLCSCFFSDRLFTLHSLLHLRPPPSASLHRCFPFLPALLIYSRRKATMENA